jgi:hypothetical protein
MVSSSKYLNDALVDPLFRVSTTAKLSRVQLVSLAAGTLGAIHVPTFLTTQVCKRIMGELDQSMMNTYDSKRYDPPALRFGPVLNDSNRGGSLGNQYWQEMDRVQDFWTALQHTADIRSACRQEFADAWQGPVEPATVAGRELFWGMIRELNDGTFVHWDEVVREYPQGLLNRLPVVQLAFNCFLSVPEYGGEVLIWRRRWHPRDEPFRAGVGYRDEVVKDETPITVRPQTGSAVLFDCRNNHAVRPSKGGRRVALSFFIGLDSTGSLMIWS